MWALRGTLWLPRLSGLLKRGQYRQWFYCIRINKSSVSGRPPALSGRHQEFGESWSPPQKTPSYAPPSKRQRIRDGARMRAQVIRGWRANTILKCVRQTLYDGRRRHSGEAFLALACQKEHKIEEWYLMPDHVHGMLPILPKYSLAQVVAFTKY